MCSIFEQKDDMSILLLNQKFMNFVKDPSEKMLTFIARLAEIVNQLQEMDELISENIYLFIYLFIQSNLQYAILVSCCFGPFPFGCAP